MKSLRRPRPRLALFVNTVAYSYQNTLLLGAHAESERLGADLFCFSGGELSAPAADARLRSSIYDLVGPGDIDGLILATSTIANFMTPADVVNVVESFAPVPVCSVGVSLPSVPSIVVDNSAGMRALTSHLITVHGRRRIAFVGGPEKNAESAERCAAYVRALELHGIPFDPRLIVPGEFTHDSGYRAARKLLDARDLACDAIVAANDWMAFGVLELLAERGVDVPREVAVVGFDDVEEASFASPPLSTVRQPIAQLGAQAVRVILGALGRSVGSSRSSLSTTLRIRRSCGCSAFYRGCASGEPMQTAGEDLSPVEQALLDGRDTLSSALRRDIDEAGGEHFISALDEVSREVSEVGEVDTWFRAIEIAAQSCRSAAEQPAAREQLESALTRARMWAGDMAEHAQARRRVYLRDTMHRVHQTAWALRYAYDESAIAGALDAWLPRLGIHSASLSIYEKTPVTSETRCKVLFSRNAESRDPSSKTRLSITPGPVVFRAGDLVPPGGAPRARSTYVVEPLLIGDDPLGHAVFHVGPHYGLIYDDLAQQLNAVLKIAKLFRETVERARLDEELHTARRIQGALLPKTRGIEGIEIAALMEPATEVGGDYYDILPFEGGAWLAIGDVSGHGFTAGLVMMMVQSIVACSTYYGPTRRPSEVWRSVNELLCESIRERLGQDEHVTLTLLRYERSGAISFAGAHEDLIIWRNERQKCEAIPTPGTWAGITPHLGAEAFTEGELVLARGDVLLLYSDGLTECMNQEGRQFGVDRLMAELAAVSALSADAIRDRIMQAVRAWQAKQADDVTLLVIRYLG